MIKHLHYACERVKNCEKASDVGAFRGWRRTLWCVANASQLATFPYCRACVAQLLACTSAVGAIASFFGKGQDGGCSLSSVAVACIVASEASSGNSEECKTLWLGCTDKPFLIDSS